MYIADPTLAGTTTTSNCNERELERRVNACVDRTRRCVFDECTRQMGRRLLKCRGKPWCTAAVAARYHRCLGRCRSALLECDRRAKRATGCVGARPAPRRS